MEGGSSGSESVGAAGTDTMSDGAFAGGEAAAYGDIAGSVDSASYAEGSVAVVDAAVSETAADEIAALEAAFALPDALPGSGLTENDIAAIEAAANGELNAVDDPELTPIQEEVVEAIGSLATEHTSPSVDVTLTIGSETHSYSFDIGLPETAAEADLTTIPGAIAYDGWSTSNEVDVLEVASITDSIDSNVSPHEIFSNADGSAPSLETPLRDVSILGQESDILADEAPFPDTIFGRPPQASANNEPNSESSVFDMRSAIQKFEDHYIVAGEAKGSADTMPTLVLFHDEQTDGEIQLSNDIFSRLIVQFGLSTESTAVYTEQRIINGQLVTDVMHYLATETGLTLVNNVRTFPDGRVGREIAVTQSIEDYNRVLDTPRERRSEVLIIEQALNEPVYAATWGEDGTIPEDIAVSLRDEFRSQPWEAALMPDDPIVITSDKVKSELTDDAVILDKVHHALDAARPKELQPYVRQVDVGSITGITHNLGNLDLAA